LFLKGGNRLRKGVIDRFESGYAVIEINGVTEDFPKHFLPSNAKIGDVVLITETGIHVCKEEIKQRARDIQELIDEVWEKDEF